MTSGLPALRPGYRWSPLDGKTQTLREPGRERVIAYGPSAVLGVLFGDSLVIRLVTRSCLHLGIDQSKVAGRLEDDDARA